MRIRCPNANCRVVQDVSEDCRGEFIRCTGCQKQFLVQPVVGNKANERADSSENTTDYSVSLIAGRHLQASRQAGAMRAVALHVNCPVCKQAVGLDHDAVLTDRTCTSCSSTYSIVAVSSASDGDGTLPVKIGRFEIRRHLGSGAFGQVWLANDPSLDRLVALKVPRQHFGDAEHSGIFLREARAAAKLRNKHIVQVYEVGEDQPGSVYIATEFIPGQTLAAVLKRGPLLPREVATIAAKIADAIHYAHEAGVVHRDLKPGNILMDERDEPYVADFGLARQISTDGSTIAGDLIGTPTYMAPEQARGEGYRADARTDVYALGVIVYEALTGQVPFRGALAALLAKVVGDPPEPPRKLDPRIPATLETICLKCLEKDVARRYQTARELAADFERYLQGTDIKARPPSRLRRSLEWSKHHRVLSSLTALLVLTSCLGVGMTVRQLTAHQTDSEGLATGSELETIASAAHMQSPVPAIKAAAQIASDKALNKSKLQALEYLARTGWNGYPGVSESFVAAMDDLTEEVRFTAVACLAKYYGIDREHPLNPEIDERLRALTEARLASGDFVESSERIRKEATAILEKHPLPASMRKRQPPAMAQPSSPAPPVQTGPTPTKSQTTAIPEAPAVTPMPPADDVEDLFKEPPQKLKARADGVENRW
jgi:serine/threonine protein kinase